MFSGVMSNAWAVGTVIAVVAGVVGFFVVLRGSTFVAHAVPLSSFAGAAGATLVGASPIAGLALFAPLTALAVGWVGRRRYRDVATALVVATMLGVGVLFLSWTTEYSSEVYALLFGEILGVTGTELWLSVGLAAGALVMVGAMFRPLLFTSVIPEVAEASGVRPVVLDLVFLVLVALVTTLTVPVVGAFLMFTLMVGPAAAARLLARTPLGAMSISVLVALATVWASIAASYATQWPIGFFVGVFGAACYLGARAFVSLRH